MCPERCCPAKSTSYFPGCPARQGQKKNLLQLLDPRVTRADSPHASLIKHSLKPRAGPGFAAPPVNWRTSRERTENLPHRDGEKAADASRMGESNKKGAGCFLLCCPLPVVKFFSESGDSLGP